MFLFDEPLSNLDASLRTQMRLEMARLHERLGATIVYVTHDQVEAMTLGDRIAVFNAGRIEQVGRPVAGRAAANSDADTISVKTALDASAALRHGAPVRLHAQSHDLTLFDAQGRALAA